MTSVDIDPSVIRRIADMHAVYRMFDQDRRLLYIGRTKNAGQRFGDHNMKRWFPLVAMIELEWFSTRAEAVLAERRAIRSEHPRYNVAETPKSERPKRQDLKPQVHYLHASAGTSSPSPRPSGSGRNLASVAIPDQARADLMTLLGRDGGITTRKAAPILGVTVWMARTYLERLRSEGVAQVYGSGRGGHWHLPDGKGGDGP